MDRPNLDLRVDEYPTHGESGQVSIYDKLGRGGHMTLSMEGARFVHERLGEILEGDE